MRCSAAAPYHGGDDGGGTRRSVAQLRLLVALARPGSCAVGSSAAQQSASSTTEAASAADQMVLRSFETGLRHDQPRRGSHSAASSLLVATLSLHHLPLLSAAVRVRSQPDSQLTLLPVGRSDIDDALSLGGKVRATRRQQAGMAEKQCDLIVYTGWLRHVLMSGG